MKLTKIIIRLFLIVGVLGVIYSFLRIPSVLKYISPKKSINVLAWPNIIDSQHFENFEKESGIKVYLTYFENYEELLVKMRAGGGDYDLIMVSDYTVHLLLDAQLVKPIDKSRLSFYSQLYPATLNLYFDPERRYSIPFSWGLYGIGVNLDAFGGVEPPSTWGLLFDPTLYGGRVGMLDDSRETIAIAASYLFGDVDEVGQARLDKIAALLHAQKPRVVMYTDLRADYLLLSNTAPVVVGNSADVYPALQAKKNVKFLVAKEGAFITMDNWMIPKSSSKDDYIYAFLNYLYQPEIMKTCVESYNFFPVLMGVLDGSEPFYLEPTPELFSTAHFFNYRVNERSLRDLWIALKS